ncbi:NosD domain-containing protein [Candidatus Aciduliprofundum boonei]|uniref:Fibronectin type III domain protein n=1 Tax=Aciduliprofundum boonei (strain DSM 19572 / T469) TaxID=439481 RepID=D3TBL1_ACIB4|nr:Fibronectin type III domain protein [Aciduliprofundum boonei T469]
MVETKSSGVVKVLVISLLLLMIFSGFGVVMNVTGVSTYKISPTFNEANVAKTHILDTSFSDFKFKKINQENINKMLELREKIMERLNESNGGKSYHSLPEYNMENSAVRMEHLSYMNTRIDFKNNATPMIDGHATGLILPDKKELENLIGHKMIIGLNTKVKEPSTVRWDLDPHFPPVGDQKWQGSCTAWAVSYYQNGFLQRMIYNWTDDSPAHLMSPSWTYNKVNGGGDYGSSFEGNAELIESVGDATLANMTYNPSDYTSWGNESAWRDAPKHRIAGYYLVYFGNDSGIETIKELLREGYLVTFAIDASQYYNGFVDGNYIISSQEYNSYGLNHAQTIVGYDDNITDDGDVGAFRVVNSWGTGFGDHGFYWLTYKALEEKVSQGWPYAYVLVPISQHSYNPKLLATWHFSNPGPRDASVNIALGFQNSNYYRTPIWDGGNYSFPSFMALDITEFYNEWVNSSYQNKFYLKIGTSNSGSSIVDSFKIEYYPYGYKYLWQNSTESPDVPATTPMVISSSPFSPSEYFPYVHVSLVNGIAHIYTDSLEYPVWIGNAGNKSDAILITTQATNGWSVSLPSKEELSAGVSIKVNMTIQLPTNAKLGDSSLITIKAVSENDTSKVYELEFNAYYVSRPIHIESNTDFAQQAQKYGWPGDGSKSNPYVINNLYILGESAVGIYINSTDVYAVINGTHIENTQGGIYLEYSSNIVIKNSILKNIIGYGILLDSSSNNIISNNTCSNNWAGIKLSHSSNNVISSNICNNNNDGIELWDFSNNNIIYNNNCSNNKARIKVWYNEGGIFLEYSSNNMISSNTCISNERYGIYLQISSNNRLYENKLVNNGISLWGDIGAFTTQEIPTNNTVNGKPVYYFKNVNMNNASVPSNAGEVILGNVTWLKIENLQIHNSTVAIEIGGSSHITIKNNNCSNNRHGINLLYSSNNTISSNTCNNNGYGIGWWFSGIELWYSSNNVISNNICNGNGNGILDLSNNNVISNNTCNHNQGEGIFVWYSSNNVISNNICNNNNDGIELWDFSNNNIIYNNTCNDNNRYGIFLEYSSNSNIIHNNICNGNEISILLSDSSNNVISNNTFSNNWAGIELSYSSNNVISNNLLTNNSGYYGIHIYSGSNWNHIYKNNFYYNDGSGSTFKSSYVQARDDGTNNHWNSTSGIGNYWYDWANNNNTNDQNGDGIVDWPYKIDGSAGAKDYYPLRCPIGESTPSQPFNLTAKTGDGYINLSWEQPVCNGSSDIIEYRIYRNGSLIATVQANQLWYNDSDVKNGVRYTYYVTAVNSIGESQPSNEVQVTPMTVPNAPESLQAKAGNRYVNLSWEVPSDNGGSAITGYRVYRNGSLIATVQANQLWYNDSDVKNGVRYTYYVTAVNSIGESQPSNEVQVTPMTVPNAPESLQAKAGNRYVNLSWEVPSDNGGSAITGYRVYRNGSLIATVQANQLWYNDSDVKNGVRYTYYVTAVNSIGESQPSNEVQVTPMTVPNAPESLQAKAGNRYVNLSWEVPSDNGGSAITGYRVYRNGSLIATVQANQLWYNDSDVKNGVRYTYYVTAVNSIGESQPSNEVQVTIAQSGNNNQSTNTQSNEYSGILNNPYYVWSIVLGLIITIVIIAVVMKKRNAGKKRRI